MRFRYRLLFLPFALLAAFAGAAPREGADPAINRPYLDADYAEWLRRFESPGREVYDRRAAIEAAINLRAGMHVADIGAGTGLFTLPFARAVGPLGRVYAVDISRPFTENILRRTRAEGLANVQVVVNSQTDTGLPDGSIDLAFLCDTYHHFEQPRAMLAAIRRALRAGGVLVVIDFERREGQSPGWILGHVRAGKQQVIEEIEAAGFRLAADEALLKENFFLRFVKPPLAR
jgi:ubiquinone/menaquinone biosynthesis C-methylase UbiE